ncbi:MAG: helix-turn-helix domain-containing protein [Phycisphaerales bacterium]|nr:helix-turn-helix domain-containing protein [Phycisphaerales bacterium]
MNKDIEQTLRKAIADSGLSYYRLAKDSGVDLRSIGRFMAESQTLRLNIAAKICRRLGLELLTPKGSEHGKRIS